MEASTDLNQNKEIANDVIRKNIIQQKSKQPTEIQLTSKSKQSPQNQNIRSNNILQNNESQPHIELKEDNAISELSDTEKKCCECFNITRFKNTMATILFFVYWSAYLVDIATMLILLWPSTGGGIRGCDCNSMNTISDCMGCWNCVWPHMETQDSQCIYFDSKKGTILYILFPILFGYCTVGWLLHEMTVWIRVCVACTFYNKEAVQYKEQRDIETDEFVRQNADHLFKTKRTLNTQTNYDISENITMHKQDTLVRYESDYNNDIMGLFPCCFQDIDRYHMKRILIMNTASDQVIYDSKYQLDENGNGKTCCRCCEFPAEISAKCCELPLFMFGISLSICWMFPFRYFWKLAVFDLYSKIWKRVCWFGVFHVLFFDVCWIAFCWVTLDVLRQAQNVGINNYIDDLGRYLERKMYESVATIIAIAIIWVTIPIYALTTDATTNTVYSPVRHHN